MTIKKMSVKPTEDGSKRKDLVRAPVHGTKIRLQSADFRGRRESASRSNSKKQWHLVDKQTEKGTEMNSRDFHHDDFANVRTQRNQQ